MLDKCKILIYSMAKCDSKFAFQPHSKYSSTYSKEQSAKIISLLGNMNMCNFSQIIAENLTNLYLQKIRLLSDAKEKEWQKEYLIKSGFADDIWEYVRVLSDCKVELPRQTRLQRRFHGRAQAVRRVRLFAGFGNYILRTT